MGRGGDKPHPYTRRKWSRTSSSVGYAEMLLNWLVVQLLNRAAEQHVPLDRCIDAAGWSSGVIFFPMYVDAFVQVRCEVVKRPSPHAKLAVTVTF
jgi:hypothetical protein